jgi:flagellar motor protein MotB
MKRFFVILITAVLFFALTACDLSRTAQSSKENSQPSYSSNNDTAESSKIDFEEQSKEEEKSESSKIDSEEQSKEEEKSESSKIDSEEQSKEEDKTENSNQEQSASITLEQRNAIRQAENYLSVMPFSRKGLIEQLKFEGYSEAVATFAVDNITVNWNEQCYKKAKDYLDVMAFSKSGLINQLEFEGFTDEQIEYAIEKVGY